MQRSIPPVASQRPAILRVRLDYGEDCGKVLPRGCLTSTALAGACGPARFGDVPAAAGRLLRPAMVAGSCGASDVMLS